MLQPIHNRSTTFFHKQLIIVLSVVIVGMAFLWLGSYATVAIIPITIAFLLAVSTDPIVSYFESISLNRTVAILLVILAYVGLVILLSLFYLPFIVDDFHLLLHDLEYAGTPESFEFIIQKMDIPAYLLSLMPLIEYLIKLTGFLLQRSGHLFQNSTVLILTLLTFPFITFFLLRDGDTLKKNIIRRVPNRFIEMLIHAISEIDNQLRKLTIDLFATSITVTLFISIAFFLLQIPAFFAISLIAGLAFLIPYYGTAIATIFSIVMIFPSSGLNYKALAIIICFATVRLAFNLLLGTKFTFTEQKLHPLMVILLLLIGTFSAGFLGLLLIIPLYRILAAIGSPLIWALQNYRLR